MTFTENEVSFIQNKIEEARARNDIDKQTRKEIVQHWLAELTSSISVGCI